MREILCYNKLDISSSYTNLKDFGMYIGLISHVRLGGNSLGEPSHLGVTSSSSKMIKIYGGQFILRKKTTPYRPISL